MLYRNYFSIIIILMITIILSWKFYFHDYKEHQNFNIYTFPKTIDQWTSQELSFEKIDRLIIGSNSLLSRRYDLPGGKHVYLYIVYSPGNPKATNPPEISYTDIGISVLDKRKESIKINTLNSPLTVNWLLIDNNKNHQIVYYWFKVGGIYTSSYWKQQMLIAFNNLIDKNEGSALIRISADVSDGHQEDTIKLINEFTALIMPQLSHYLP